MEPTDDAGKIGPMPGPPAPLAPAAIIMSAGILLGRYVPLPMGLWAVLGVSGLLAAVVSFRRKHLRGLTVAGIAAAILFASAVAGCLAYRRIEPNHVVTFSDDGSVLATIRGRVVSRPAIREAGTSYWQPPRTSFLLEAGQIRRADGRWTPAQGTVSVTVGEPADEVAADQYVELLGTLRRIRPPANPGQYDWRAARRYRGILVNFFVPGADGVRLIEGRAGNPVSILWRRARLMARRHLGACGQEEESLLLEALILGQRDPALRDLNQAMVEAGIAHFLSISGLHLGIFLGFVYLLCRLFMLTPRRSAWVVLTVLAAYVLLAEPRAPLLRAAIMAASICVAVISDRSVSMANALASAAIILLLVDPMQLFDTGFQLSFGIVCGIFLLHGPIKRVLFGRWLRKRGLMVFRGDQRFRRWMYFRGADWLMSLVCLSVAAYVSAVGLVAYRFGLLSPYAPLLSILLLPTIVAVLIPAYVSTALAFITPNLAAAIGNVAAVAAGLLRDQVMLLKHLPWLSIDLFTVPAWLVVLYYVTVGLWLAVIRRACQPGWLAVSRRIALSAATAATIALVFAVVVIQRPAAAPPDGRLHVLDVGHGSMTLLQAPDGGTYLFDAGTLSSANAYHRILRPFLRAKRLASPRIVFISHANIDHYSALPDMIAHRPPARVYLNESFGLREDDPPQAKELLAALQARGVEVVRLRQGQTVSLGRAGRVEVLWPPGRADMPSSRNDSSLVLRVFSGGRSILLPGDISQEVESRLIERTPEKIRSDVLLLPHHGSVTPTLAAFIEAVGPEVLLQSSSFRSDSSQLRRAIAGRRRYATFRDGWICLRPGEGGITVETMQGP